MQYGGDMTIHEYHPEQFPVLRADLDLTALENQLHGEEFDRAQNELALLTQVRTDLAYRLNVVDSSIGVLNGEPPTTMSAPTPEGMIVQPIETIAIAPQDVPKWREHQAATSLAYARTNAQIEELGQRTWQETGIRLFEDWRKEEGDAEARVHDLFDLYNDYTPDDFFEPCGTTREEAEDLFRKALSTLSQRWKGFKFDFTSSPGHTVYYAQVLADEFGIDAAAEYGI